MIIASLRKKVKSLEDENKKLKEQLKVDWVAIYEKTKNKIVINESIKIFKKPLFF